MDKQLLRKGSKIIALFLLAILLYFILKYTLLYGYPFLIAAVIAVLLNPLVSFLEHKMKFPRLGATIFIFILFFLIFAGLMITILNELISGIVYLVDFLPKHIKTFYQLIFHFFQQKLLPLYENLLTFIDNSTFFSGTISFLKVIPFLDQIGEASSHLMTALLKRIHIFLMKIPESIVIFLFIWVLAFVLTYDYFYVRDKLRKIVSLRLRRATMGIIKEGKKLIIKYVKAQFVLIFMTAFITYLGLLMFRVNHAFTIASLLALVDLLPLVGTGIIFLPWIGYLFLSGNYPLTIKLSLLYIAIIIFRQIVEPKVLSDFLNVRPVIILTMMFISFQLWGALGILLSPLWIILFVACKRTGVIEKFFHFIKT